MLDIATRLDGTNVLLAREDRLLEAARRQGADRLHGGPFTVHGAKELPIDLDGALRGIVTGQESG